MNIDIIEARLDHHYDLSSIDLDTVPHSMPTELDMYITNQVLGSIQGLKSHRVQGIPDIPFKGHYTYLASLNA